MASSVFLFPGVISFLGPTVLFPSGSVSAPGMAFAAEPSSGWYRAGAGDIRLAVLGVDRITAGTGSTGINAPDGGGYFRILNGVVQVNSATFQLANGGTNKNSLDGSTTDGIINWTPATTTNARPMLTFGGLTSAFPAIRRQGGGIEIVLADESAYTPLTVSALAFGSPANSVFSGVKNGGATGLTAADTNRINYTPVATAQSFMLVGCVNVTAWTTPASFTVAVTYKDASGNARTDTAALMRGSTGANAAAITAVDRWYYTLPCIDIDNSATSITVSTTGTFTGTPVYNHAASLYRVR
jgi:hypothetical protein